MCILYREALSHEKSAHQLHLKLKEYGLNPTTLHDGFARGQIAKQPGKVQKYGKGLLLYLEHKITCGEALGNSKVKEEIENAYRITLLRIFELK